MIVKIIVMEWYNDNLLRIKKNKIILEKVKWVLFFENKNEKKFI